jgi:hypothetical protein
MFDSRFYFAEPGWHSMYKLFKVRKVMAVIETVCVYMCLICAASSGTVWSRGGMSWQTTTVTICLYNMYRWCVRLEIVIILTWKSRFCNCLLYVGC